MRLSVKLFFHMRDTHLETRSATLGALLQELSRNYEMVRTECFDTETMTLGHDYAILLNGSAADGLDTGLKDGDRVEIIRFSPIAGG